MSPTHILERLTGISCPVFGVSWTPTEQEITIAQRVISYLEDRRVLCNPLEMECPKHCEQSVVEIRRFLTAEIGKMKPQQELRQHLQALRAECRQFLNAAQGPAVSEVDHPLYGDTTNLAFFSALGQLRAVFGFRVGIVAVMYGLKVDGDLEKILPATPKEA